MPYKNKKGNRMRLALLKNGHFGFTEILLTVVLETVTGCLNICSCTFTINTCKFYFYFGTVLFSFTYFPHHFGFTQSNCFIEQCCGVEHAN